MDEKLSQELRNEAARICEDAEYSAKSHYNAEAMWRWAHYCIGLPNAVLAAFAGVQAFVGCKTLAGILAVVVAAIAAIETFLNPSGKSASHHNAAGQYHKLRNRARMFANIDMINLSDIELQQKFDRMAENRDTLNSASPQIPRWAFVRARKGIEEGEATYRDDS